MSLPNIVKKHTKHSGHWYLNPDDDLWYWQEFYDADHESGSYELIPPEQVAGVSRSVEFMILFAHTVQDTSQFGYKKKKIYYKQTAKATLKPDCGLNVWIISDVCLNRFDRKIKNTEYYLREFGELGITERMPLCSTDLLRFEVDEPIEIGKEEFDILKKQTAYFFDSVKLANNGSSIADYVTEVKP